MKTYRKFARFGIFTKGIVFFLMGCAALITATQLADALKSEDDILKWISNLEFGRILILVIAIGLSSYILSRAYLSINNHDYNGAHHKPKYRRVGYFINGLGYCFLLFTCIKLLLGLTDDDKTLWEPFLLESVWGKIIVIIIAIGLAISALNEWWMSVSSMMNKMTLGALLSKKKYTWLMILGRVGRFSRGIVFAVFSYIMARSAFYDMSSLPKGADAAFRFLRAASGAWIMGIVSVGVILYGVFLMLGSRHRNIPFKETDL